MSLWSFQGARERRRSPFTKAAPLQGLGPSKLNSVRSAPKGPTRDERGRRCSRRTGSSDGHEHELESINESSGLRSKSSGFPRKEVIQPHLPVRLPCYDFTPIIDPTFDGCLPRGVSPPASGVANFRGVTGGVYKARERIHRGVADPRLLATPPSWRRVAASNPNRDRLFGIRSTSRFCSPLYRPM
jgi:hypothetical protein